MNMNKNKKKKERIPKTHSSNQIIQFPHHTAGPRGYMFPRHSGYFDRGFLFFLAVVAGDIDHDIVVEI